MAAVSTRTGLKEYALRALGAPVLEINVDDDQIEDRIDEALDYWKLYHYEGVEQIYLKQLIRASEITLSASVASTFALAEVITGATSGATAEVCRESQRSSSGTLLLVRNVVGTFTPGETINGSAGHTATLSSITLREYDNRYIEIPDYVWGVTQIISAGQASSSKNIFDLQYQLRLNDLYDLTSTSLIYYKTVMSHLALLDFELNGHQRFRFNRLNGRLYLDANWATDFILGDYIIVQAYRPMDPTTWSKIYNEPWLKHYVTALFKKQWATNIKKFSGIQLPGGVTLDGDKLYDESTSEIKELEDELQNKSAPLDFFMG
ncbi:neck protein [uncultured Caudovirales phage]|uniref:Neck protein n=1 Tax=uncultured Caudovirales phage TaxID=2100421 RepID=A0A6J5RNN6_9CAUD|nr:neck protein [uncultured Caudovirales phage]CAB4182037.1 neck protein [uncultured Caudovirales phage]CAB4198699.1 neck protein [uncultured Caudovirales phage]CAB4211573.1 neck protein [uncultured Caudovirales phage]CAB5238686.1 neck protein [uncultured Caudovirales phage]